MRVERRQLTFGLLRVRLFDEGDSRSLQQKPVLETFPAGVRLPGLRSNRRQGQVGFVSTSPGRSVVSFVNDPHEAMDDECRRTKTTVRWVLVAVRRRFIGVRYRLWRRRLHPNGKFRELGGDFGGRLEQLEYVLVDFLAHRIGW